jgi:hypothetical protein
MGSKPSAPLKLPTITPVKTIRTINVKSPRELASPAHNTFRKEASKWPNEDLDLWVLYQYRNMIRPILGISRQHQEFLTVPT